MKRPQAAGAAAEASFALQTVDVRPSLDQRIDGLLFGVKWRDAIVTYSDPDRRTDYGPFHPELLSDFRRLDADQLASVHAILSGFGMPQALAGFSVQGFTNLTLRYVGGGAGGATLRAANTSDPGTAYAYFPREDPSGGDAFFGASGATPEIGNYHHLTIIHELGHTLGLKHGHDQDVFGALPSRQDSMEYSVMTYRGYVGANVDEGYHNEKFGFAQSLMMFDIAALQHLYGADYSTNAGDTVYSWSRSSGRTFVDGVAAPAPGANRIFLTVWDGGGADTYDLSDYRTALEIDLAPGGFSTFARAQLADLGGGGNDGLARGNVFNALLHKGDPRSLIENAIGGWGADQIRGNAAGNLLDGRGGGDRLQGFDGRDTLLGACGADALYGGGGDDILVGGAGRDLLSGGHGADIFRFLGLGDSGPGRRDLLQAAGGAVAFAGAGAAGGDRIDLSALDANLGLAGDQAFRFGDARGAGRLWVTEAGGDTLVRASVDARAGWEFELAIADVGVGAGLYAAVDFIL